jgi:LysM repeat protein
MTQEGRLSRRRLIGGALALGLGGVLARGGREAEALQGTHHLVWVWQFTTDASPEKIAGKLRENDLGILLKTHDGVKWMAEYDKSPYAVSGPAQVATLAKYYEQSGVPFHAWAVIHGSDPLGEARMAADVLAAGARSLFLDVEPSSGFWVGTPADALTFGRELRRLQPNGRIILSLDPRPWMLKDVPVKEFASFSDEIAPQQYWRTFNTPANYRRFQESGYPVPAEGITPEFLLAVSKKVFEPLGRPLLHVGQGATPEKDEWRRFIDGAYGGGSDIVSVWRYGVTSTDVFNTLREIPPRRPPALAASGTVGPGGVYTVQAGDELVQLNGLADPGSIQVGQQLKIPGGAAVAAPAAATAGASSAQGGATRSYTVQSGDTLGAIAARFGVSVSAIAELNGLADVHSISIGQEIKIPA